MGLFDKKYCAVCNAEIGLLGGKKLEDGIICKACASKLSPFFSERRHSTVSEIQQQLSYREENAAKLEEFHPDRTYGEWMKLYVDTAGKTFAATQAKDWRGANPDLIAFSQVMACDLDIIEHKEELYREVDGKRESYNPQRFTYKYEFRMKFDIDSPWFNGFTMELSGERPSNKAGELYRKYEDLAFEIQETLMPGVYVKEEKEEAPKPPIVKPHAASPTIPKPAKKPVYTAPVMPAAAPAKWQCKCGAMNTGRFCTNCGAPRPSAFVRYRCNKCGWVPDDPSNPPNFCPRCGDAFDQRDRI